MATTSLADSTARNDDDGGLTAGSVVAEKYRIDATLGVGGMGIVYAATNVLTDKRVAMKWMLPAFAEDALAVARFMREARTVGSIEHPHVVEVFDVGKDGDTPFLVMELLRGSSLASRLRDGPMEAPELVEILVPAMRGIHAAHQTGLVHRDLKPANIFVCTDRKGRLKTSKVLDFGISKSIAGDVEIESITRSGAVMGTPQYMAPEQIRGMELDARADVYALGAILYEALTGELPFKAKTFTALAIEIATGWLRPPTMLAPKLDRKLETVIMRALARERDVRFPDVASLARALEPFGRGVRFDDEDSPVDRSSVDGAPLPPPVAPPEVQREPERDELPRSKSRVWIAVAIVPIAALAIGIAVWLAYQPEQPPRSREPARIAEPAPEPITPAEEPAGVEPPPVEEATAPTLEAPPVEPRPPVVRRTPRPPPQAATPAAAPVEEDPPPAHTFRTQGVAEDEF